MNIALLVVDMQKAFFDNASEESMKNAVAYINYSVELFRENHKKIIWIQDGNGTEGFEIIDELNPQQNEKQIVKHYGNSFNKTELMDYLTEEKIDTIIITGYCAENCVLSTYRGALDLDLTPVILKNGIASENKENVKFVEDISEMITIGLLEKIIQNL